MKKVRVTWVRSAIGYRAKHRRTVEALGLRRMGQTVEKELTPQIQGMIKKVEYLLKVEDMGES